MKLFVATLCALLFAAGAGVAPAQAGESVTTRRLAGPTRYETAVAISQATFPEPTRYDAVVARGDLFPDALAGTYLAGLYNGGGPLLLTQPTQLPAATAAELERLDVRRVWLLGSTDAVGAGVEAEIRRLGADVIRIGGATRYDTAAAISGHNPESPPATMFLASGENFADALAVAPLTWEGTGAAHGSLLLTPSDSLHPAARDDLERHRPSTVYIVGGTSAISAAVEAQIRAICDPETGCLRVQRIAGDNRYETAVAIADLWFAERSPATHVNLARADTFPDAIAGGFHGGVEIAPVLFAQDPTRLADATREWLQRQSAQIESIDVFGDESAVSNDVVEQARQAATASG